MKILACILFGLISGSAFARPVSYQCAVSVYDYQTPDHTPKILKADFILDGNTSGGFLIDAQAVVTKERVYTGEAAEHFDWNTKAPFFSMRLHAYDYSGVIESTIAAGYKKNGRVQSDSTSSTRGQEPAQNLRSKGSTEDTSHEVECELVR